MADVNLGQLAATVWDKKVNKTPDDVIFNSRALFYALQEKGFKEEVAGGKTFEFTFEFAENTTNKSMSETGTIDTSRIDTFDAATYTVAIVAGSVVFTELEKLRAQDGKVDLVGEKLENGRDSHIATLNRMFWASGGGTDPDGIQKIISSTPTTGTVGTVNRETYSFWRNRQAAGTQSSSAFDNLRSSMRSVYNQCSLGGLEATPTSAITTRTVFEGYESLLTPNERYMKDGANARGGNAGFANRSLQFKDAGIFYDEDAPSGNLYFVNGKYLKVVYLKGGWMKFDSSPIEPANQLTQVHRLRTYCQMVTSNPRHLGVVTAIS